MKEIHKPSMSASMVVITNANGDVTTSKMINVNELNMLNSIRTNVQTQIDNTNNLVQENTTNLANVTTSVGQNTVNITALQNLTQQHTTSIADLTQISNGHNNQIQQLTIKSALHTEQLKTKKGYIDYSTYEDLVGSIGSSTGAYVQLPQTITVPYDAKLMIFCVSTGSTYDLPVVDVYVDNVLVAKYNSPRNEIQLVELLLKSGQVVRIDGGGIDSGKTVAIRAFKWN